MKSYSRAAMLSLKIYENLLIFNFLMGVGVWGGGGGGGGIRRIDCFHCFMKLEFIDVKSNEVSHLYRYAKKNL